MQNFELKKVGGARATHWHPYDYQIYSNFLIVFRIEDGWRLGFIWRCGRSIDLFCGVCLVVQIGNP